MSEARSCVKYTRYCPNATKLVITRLVSWQNVTCVIFGHPLFSKHVLVIISGILGIENREMNVTSIVKGPKVIQTVCPSRDTLYP